MSAFSDGAFWPTGEGENRRPVYCCVRRFCYRAPDGQVIWVEEGDLTDGPSVPWWALWLIDTWKMVKSAAIHDKMRHDLRFTKKQGDDIFLMAMKDEGVPAWQRTICYWAVRMNNTR